MIRRAFFTASGLCGAMLFSGLVLKAGPAIESRSWPVRAGQSVAVLERQNGVGGYAGRICWAWTFTKLRPLASDNLDAFLHINGEAGGVVAPFEMDSGRPWGMTKFAVAVRPEPYTLRYCVPLPPYVGAADTVRVRQTAYYPGLLGLWRLPVAFPDVVSEGVKPP